MLANAQALITQLFNLEQKTAFFQLVEKQLLSTSLLLHLLFAIVSPPTRSHPVQQPAVAAVQSSLQLAAVLCQHPYHLLRYRQLAELQ